MPTKLLALRNVALCCTLVLAACERRAPGPWQDMDGYRWRRLAPAAGAGEGFHAVRPRRTTITFVNTVSDSALSRNRNLGNGSGVALGDIDGDGLVDIYLARLEGPNALYRNLGNWRFAEEAALRGVAAPDRHSTGVTLADVDGDGDLDLVLLALGGPNAVFVNDGTGRFREQPLAGRYGSATATLADIDGDGDLDLYIANYKVRHVLDLFPPEALAYERIVRATPEGGEVLPEFREHFRIMLDRERRVGALSQRGEADQLFLNTGRGVFQPASFTDGRFRDAAGRVLTEPPDYFGLAARFHDVNGDGHPDLYVCNDFEGPDAFWLNDGRGGFREISPLAVRTTSHASMAVDFSDVDRDGDVDVFVADMLSLSPRRRKAQLATNTPLPKLVGDLTSRPQIPRNTLFANRGDGTFAEIARYAGVEGTEWSWASVFLDVDLDGYEDLLVANGYQWDVLDADAQSSAQRTAMRMRDAEITRYAPLRVENLALRNTGRLTFQDATAAWGFGRGPDITHGMAAGDLDGDGDLDLVLNRFRDTAVVLRNEATGPRVAVRLRGRPPNTNGVGALIEVTPNDRGIPRQTKEVTEGGLYASDADAMYTFATGRSTALEIAVRWRSGRRTVVRGAVPGRLYEIDEPRDERAHAGGPASADGAPARPPAWFADHSALLAHQHADAAYDDFARQPLLPNKLSQLGPGVTWYDVDGDGDDDLIVPSGSGGRLAMFVNDGGRFRRRAALEAPFDQTTALVLGDGRRRRTLIGQANYEARTADQGLRVAGVIAWDGAGSDATPVVAGDASSVGPLALADVDGDGDLDLFVGGRVVPAAYPLPATSRLLRNDEGRFIDDERHRAALAAVGLVSAAQFSDLDGDGDPDLLLAIEWGLIRVLQNEHGRFVDRTSAWGLDHLTGRWNGIATVDLNGDGRMDVVATNWGRNTIYAASSERPLRVYYGDVDRNGVFDVFVARADAAGGPVRPLADYRDLAAAIPYLQRRMPTARAYAGATLDELLGSPAEHLGHAVVATLEHHVLLNRGGRFDPRPLAAVTQFAPAFGIAVADFNGDGHEDVFVSQNFTPTPLGVERYDAGRGVLLIGDGVGGLQPVAATVSGIAVYGDGRGAAVADYDGDRRPDLAVAQNGAAVRLYRNVQATPGVRVRLLGGTGNPDGIGAKLRLVYAGGLGPAREVRAGAGYWSQDAPATVLGVRTGQEPTGVWVRWPDGTEAVHRIAPGENHVVIRRQP